jgi:hypothetical protein
MPIKDQEPKAATAPLWNGYALVIAVSDYKEIKPLPATILNDARDVASVLTSGVYCGYASANVRLLLDRDASLAKIRDALAWLAKVAGPEDSVVVYFSGHGARLTDTGSPESTLVGIRFTHPAPTACGLPSAVLRSG